jgi:hypothetical protein
VTPLKSGIAGNIGGISGPATGTVTAYGSTFNANYFVLDHKAYLVAPTTGTYTFTITADDIAYLWVGPTAYAGWNSASAAAKSFSSTSATYSTFVLTGAYIPFRVMYANAQGTSTFSFKLTGPGLTPTTIVDGSTALSTNVVQQGCGLLTALSAPPFSSWGDEGTLLGLRRVARNQLGSS